MVNVAFKNYLNGKPVPRKEFENSRKSKEDIIYLLVQSSMTLRRAIRNSKNLDQYLRMMNKIDDFEARIEKYLKDERASTSLVEMLRSIK